MKASTPADTQHHAIIKEATIAFTRSKIDHNATNPPRFDAVNVPNASRAQVDKINRRDEERYENPTHSKVQPNSVNYFTTLQVNVKQVYYLK